MNLMTMIKLLSLRKVLAHGELKCNVKCDQDGVGLGVGEPSMERGMENQ